MPFSKTVRKFERRHLLHIAQRVALRMLRGYKWAISPLFPPSCRYVPTCSEYAMEAVERYGVLRGGLRSMMRLLRCHPFAHGGYDPVVRVERTSDERVNQQRPATEIAHSAL